MIVWPAAPYLAWARSRPAARYDLAASDLLPVTAHEWPAMCVPAGDDGDGDGADLEAALAAAIAAHAGVSRDRVVTAVGASGANFLALAALVRPGDAVLVEDPGHLPLAAACRLFGAEVVALPRRAPDGYTVEAEAIAAALTRRTRLVVLSRPHNPSGALLGTRALEAIADVAERARVHVLVDEVYLDTLGGASLAPAAVVSERFISTSSLTKAYGLVGVRCGWALAAPGVAARMRAARAVVAPAAARSSGLALRAFADLALLADRARRIIVSNRSHLERRLAGRDDLAWMAPGGGTVAFPRLLRVTDVDAFVDRLLVEHHTAVIPGRFFGHPQHVRVAFGTGAEELARGLDALATALDAAAHVETAHR
ncbi:MAG: pyridoxal phosphate-dependent aminotransferase [Vicinamibacteraceae bacterium]